MRHRYAAVTIVLALLAGSSELSSLHAQECEQPWDAGKCHFYFGVGSQGLRRSHITSAPVGLISGSSTTTTTGSQLLLVNGQDAAPGDPTETADEQVPFDALIPGTAVVTTTTFPDSGVRPPPGSQTFGNFNYQTALDMTYGFRGTIGYGNGDWGFELTGYRVKTIQKPITYTSEVLPPGPPSSVVLQSIDQNAIQNTFDTDGDDDAFVNSISAPNGAGSTSGTPSANRLNLAFFNAPAGFNGNNGLWLQADKVTLTFQNEMSNLEFNYRFPRFGNDDCWFSLQLLAGFRYVEAKEQFGIITQDDPTPTPTTVAAYIARTRNRIFAPQLGVELRTDVIPSVVALTATFKGAVGVNMAEREISLVRGDGFLGFDDGDEHRGMSQVYEIGLMAEFTYHQCLQLRAGYTAMWLVNLAEASQQVDYDLSHTTGRGVNNGTIFYSGPTFELGFIF